MDKYNIYSHSWCSIKIQTGFIKLMFKYRLKTIMSIRQFVKKHTM